MNFKSVLDFIADLSYFSMMVFFLSDSGYEIISHGKDLDQPLKVFIIGLNVFFCLDAMISLFYQSEKWDSAVIKIVLFVFLASFASFEGEFILELIIEYISEIISVFLAMFFMVVVNKGKFFRDVNGGRLDKALESAEGIVSLGVAKGIKNIVIAKKEKMERKDGVIIKNSRNGVLIHEAGHALLVSHPEYRDKLIDIRIMPNGKDYSGYVSRSKHSGSERYCGLMKIDCMISLAGNVAEQIMFDDVLLGSDGDMRSWNAKVQRLIIHDNLDFIYTSSPTPEELEHNSRIISKYRRDYESEIKMFLLKNKDALIELADLLSVKEHLYAKDVEHIFDKVDWNYSNEI